MENEKQLSGEQSMAIIQQMIGQAKINYSESGLSWLLWGIMLFIASISTYVFISIDADDIFLGWNIFGVVSILLLIYLIIVKPRKKPVRTYVDDVLKMVNIGFVVCMALLILAINIDAVNPKTGFAFFLMIFGFLMLVKSESIKSRSLLIGAIVNWAGTLAIFFVKEFKYAMLVMAVAVLVGYIIPGLLLRIQYKKSISLKK